ncbi:uncharacterized protein B0I36DRAFT_355800 [Microdochium trichocladiopsis]|uniref:Uncharacterized protein n=1 Tax=Microdochium trichocladiopsis TaxID=1682393 RepID=A0A9P9BJG4_9PEZI|nr:uncharacterized protein B0I36DRAFT_355800 [Microdochium trichocladiopsis]KAH7014611.1 hypothetical protein B0I36DRAFT_355800 [Microdochium trichocladiopsis]
MPLARPVGVEVVLMVDGGGEDADASTQYDRPVTKLPHWGYSEHHTPWQGINQVVQPTKLRSFAGDPPVVWHISTCDRAVIAEPPGMLYVRIRVKGQVKLGWASSRDTSCLGTAVALGCCYGTAFTARAMARTKATARADFERRLSEGMMNAVRVQVAGYFPGVCRHTYTLLGTFIPRQVENEVRKWSVTFGKLRRIGRKRQHLWWSRHEIFALDN